MDNKFSVCIFPYINIDKSFIMGDFEIHPYNNFDFSKELDEEKIEKLGSFVNSFRNTFFSIGKDPSPVQGVGILKYKGTILRNQNNSEGIMDHLKILFLIMKLHINYDFNNPSMRNIDPRIFEIFECTFGDMTVKYGNIGQYKDLQSTVPENIHGLRNIRFYPIEYSLTTIPTDFDMSSNGTYIFRGSNERDFSKVYANLVQNTEYYNNFLNIASIFFEGLDRQKDLFFYYAIIPSIIEVLLYPILPNESKKQKAIDYGKIMDQKIIQNNEFIETITYIKKGVPQKEELGLIARTFNLIYDLRNDLLHEGKRSFSKMKVSFGGVDIRLYDIFQLIAKFSILSDLVGKNIIDNQFFELEFEGNMRTTGNINITGKKVHTLFMDDQLNNLLKRCDSESKYGVV